MNNFASTELPSIMAMWEFFNENLHFKLSKYEFVEGGVRVIYINLSEHVADHLTVKRFS